VLDGIIKDPSFVKISAFFYKVLLEISEITSDYARSVDF
jgi:hypothetical protein